MRRGCLIDFTKSASSAPGTSPPPPLPNTLGGLSATVLGRRGGAVVERDLEAVIRHVEDESWPLRRGRRDRYLRTSEQALRRHADIPPGRPSIRPSAILARVRLIHARGMSVSAAKSRVMQARVQMESGRTAEVEATLAAAEKFLDGETDADKAPVLADIAAIRAEVANTMKPEDRRALAAAQGKLRQARAAVEDDNFFGLEDTLGAAEKFLAAITVPPDAEMTAATTEIAALRAARRGELKPTAAAAPGAAAPAPTTSSAHVEVPVSAPPAHASAPADATATATATPTPPVTWDFATTRVRVGHRVERNRARHRGLGAQGRSASTPSRSTIRLAEDARGARAHRLPAPRSGDPRPPRRAHVRGAVPRRGAGVRHLRGAAARRVCLAARRCRGDADADAARAARSAESARVRREPIAASARSIARTSSRARSG